MDRTTYTADPNFSAIPGGSSLGGGKVVYIGTGSGFTLSGLTQNTTYYLQVYEYNGSGCGLNYLTTTASGTLATISNAAITAGQQYHVAIKLADGSVGLTGPITAS